MNQENKRQLLASHNQRFSSSKQVGKSRKRTDQLTYDAPRIIKSWRLTVRAIGGSPPIR